ncbi:hypothetical protein FHG87_026077, partial [Trinorchestia longiramus]
VNNPTLRHSYMAMVGKANIEGSKSRVALDARRPQTSYPCGNFS